MNKSVLVIDTPETCLDCMFCFELDEGIKAHCSVVSGDEYSGFFRTIDCEDGYCQGKPGWCPLKEVPEEEHIKELLEEEHNEYCLDEYCDGYDDGWNTFRSRILGENNNV